jgi:hypothetical protein
VVIRSGLIAAALAFCICARARAQDDGPRVYQLAPKGAQVFTAFAVVKRGNEGPEPGEVALGAKTDNNLLVFRYARTFDWLGRAVTPFVIAPTGQVKVEQGGTSHTSSGFGDAQIGATVGLLGAPALPREAYPTFRPTLSTSLLARVFFPTGAYSRESPVNLGANRFAYQLGLPTTFPFGHAYGDPQLTALELLPTVTFYGPNDAPFGAASKRTQDPLFSLEGHLTHNFSRRIWASADVLLRSGGETTADGVANDDPVRGWSAGASAAFPLTRAANLILTYEHVVARADTGPDGWFFRTALVVPF